MAAGRDMMEGKRAESNDENDIDSDEEEEPNFSDPEDFVDDITEEGAMILLYVLR